MHGNTNCNYANGSNYTGDWVEGRQTGHGVFTWSNGDRYEGQFKDNQKHGTGTQYYASEGNYIGDWVEDKKAGKGVFIWTTGDRYEGQYKNDAIYRGLY